MPAKGDAAMEHAGGRSSGVPPAGASRWRSHELVDYERVASLYEEGRALPAEVLARWGDVVRPYLPSGTRRILDLGAGTGIFARAWPRWTQAAVIAVP
jgi:hypothetical protein